MTLQIALDALFILHKLREGGYDAYVVGGAVRDLLLRKASVTDYDFTTNATPEQLLVLFPGSFYENQFGTVMITPADVRALMQLPLPAESPHPIPPRTDRIIDIASATKIHVSLRGGASAATDVGTIAPAHHNYEITTYRSDGVYADHRRPTTVTWGTSLAEDLARRDFTINALALQVDDQTLKTVLSDNAAESGLCSLDDNGYVVIDPHHGRQDLDKRLITTVGDPHQRFSEDALRMLRAIRFAVQLDMDITEQTYAAIGHTATEIAHISWERIRDEFMKMLASPRAADAIVMLDETGLLQHILPELQEGKGVDQAGHHTTDVWTHSLDALANCPTSDPIVRLATLLHDVGKPRSRDYSEHGKPTFYNHDVIGSRMATAVAKRLRLSKQEQQRIFILVRYHMFHYQPFHTDASIRRFMRKVGLEHVDDILDLREADRLGSGARKTSWRLEEMKQRMIEQLHQPMEVTDLAINGSDLMQELKLQPGPIIGELLKRLLELVLEQPELNTKENLLSQARELLTQQT